MNELIRSLVDCLKKETETYLRLAILAEQQKDLLVAGKTEALPENIRLEEKEVFALSPLVGQRNDLLSKMAKALGLKVVGLKEILEKVPSDQALDLRKAVIELVKSAKKLEETNQINEKLLANGLSDVNFTLRLIRSGGKAKSLAAAKATEEKKPFYVDRVI